jgi:hypothetical protein
VLDRDGLCELADILEMKAQVKAKRGEDNACVFYEVAEGIRALAEDPNLPPLMLSVPFAGPYKALADLAVALVTDHITIHEYIEAAAALGLTRLEARERGYKLCHMATATA